MNSYHCEHKERQVTNSTLRPLLISRSSYIALFIRRGKFKFGLTIQSRTAYLLIEVTSYTWTETCLFTRNNILGGIAHTPYNVWVHTSEENSIGQELTTYKLTDTNFTMILWLHSWRPRLNAHHQASRRIWCWIEML